jgi:hypothetical protein
LIPGEPAPILTDGPRYSALPLPPYRFVPGRAPHPRRDPRGHSFGKPDAPLPPWHPDDWRGLEAWLHGVDLYNRAFFWECHETLEALWIAGGRTTPHARFVRGIVLVAAACLNRHLGKRGGGRRQAMLGIEHLEALLPARVYMGVEIRTLTAGVAACFDGQSGPPPILLQGFEAGSHAP